MNVGASKADTVRREAHEYPKNGKCKSTIQERTDPIGQPPPKVLALMFRVTEY